MTAAHPQEILDAMIDTMGEVGDRFSRDEIFVPEVLISAKTMKNGLAVLRPLLAEGATENLGTLHYRNRRRRPARYRQESRRDDDQRAQGYDVIDLGVDVKASQFVDEIKKTAGRQACRTVRTSDHNDAAMRETVKTLKNSDLGDFKVIVGGAPVTPDFASEIGADGYAPDAKALQ